MEIVIILFLILLNGALALAEIAILSSRKSRLKQMANEGNSGAQRVLVLLESPNQFLSTIQIGITLIGILAGVFGGVTIAKGLAIYFSYIPIVSSYSEGVAIAIVVGTITILSLVIGELVPKRVGLSNPEQIASYIALPMEFLVKLGGPIVNLLSFSTDFVLKMLGITSNAKEDVSEEEVKLLIREGTKTGVFEVAERDIVERTLRLGDKKVNMIMTPRKEVIWVDADISVEAIRKKITKHYHSHFPVCRGSLDRVVGVIHTEDLLLDFATEEHVDLKHSLHKPLLVPAHTAALKLLELFKKSGIHMAIIIDEYGAVMGVVTLSDVLEEIVGDIPTVDEFDQKDIIKRDDGTFLIDGFVSTDEFKEYFKIRKLPGETAYHTVAGFVMNRLGRVPQAGDYFIWENYKFEVVDMDHNRVDKVLVIALPTKKTN